MAKKVLITPKSYFKVKGKMLPLLKDYELIFNDTGTTFTEAEMIELAQDVEGIIVGVDPITEKVINRARNLKAISKYGVGLDNIDIKAVRKEGILLKNTPGTNNISVAELTIALIFNIARNISWSINNVKNFEWKRIKGIELTDKSLGLIGCGNIGREVAYRADGLKMKVKIYDPYFNDMNFLNKFNVELVPLDTLLSTSDFVSLHLPLNDETKGFISKEELRKMKSSAFLINTARGNLINEDDLLWALEEGEIAGAACDVFSKEPPEKNPLLEKDNFLLTPHIGANTVEAVIRMATNATENLLQMLARGGAA